MSSPVHFSHDTWEIGPPNIYHVTLWQILPSSLLFSAVSSAFMCFIFLSPHKLANRIDAIASHSHRCYCKRMIPHNVNSTQSSIHIATIVRTIFPLSFINGVELLFLFEKQNKRTENRSQWLGWCLLLSVGDQNATYFQSLSPFRAFPNWSTTFGST